MRNRAICSINGGGAGSAGATGATGATGAAGAAGASGAPGYLTTVLTKPVLASFTIRNQGTATIADSAAGIYFNDKTTSDNWRYVWKASPASPYAITLLGVTSLERNASAFPAAFGLAWRDSVSGHYSIFHYQPQLGVSGGTLHVTRFSNETTSAGDDTTMAIFPASGQPFWLKLSDDGTNVNYFYSADGVNWLQILTVAYASGYLGAGGYNQIGLAFNPNVGAIAAGFNPSSTALHWAQSAS